MASTWHLWNRAVLPPLADRMMGRSAFMQLRMATTAAAYGKVLEIGIGAGHNLGCYPRSIDSVIGVDPSLPLLRRACRRAAWMAFPVQLRQAGAERLPVQDRSIDVAVSTWTLCALDDPAAALGEIRRVLKPGGILSFCEHCLSPEPAVARWQRRLTPLWRRIAGGCRLDRPCAHAIEAAGFRIVRHSFGPMLSGPAALGWQCQGLARLK